jgi:hypothetical protein
MTSNRSLALRITLGIVLFLLAGLSALQMIPPRAVPAEAPAESFSAERAMADLEVVAGEPHAAGSEAQARVRAYIIGQVEALGLSAEVETSGQVSNILVRLRGSDPTLTVLVSGHYDSHPPAPGAGDNGISVAAMLESLRVLDASPALRNDVLFLFTDGEELGWLGALAYIEAHPEAKNEVGALLVFDARPGNGPLQLLETSPGDAWLVRQISGLALPVWAGSWKNIQERRETDTDFDVFQPAGFTGLVLENESNGTRYHTARDDVASVSPARVQAFGKALLALTDRFGAIDLRTRAKGADLVFFTLSGVGLVAYPYWVMLAFSILGLLGLPALILLAWRRERFSFKKFGLGLLGSLLAILLIVLCAQLAWGALKEAHSTEVALYGGFEGSAAWQAGFMAAAGLLMSILVTTLSHRLGGIHLTAAAVILFFLLGIAFNAQTQSDNPLTTPWLAWPFLGGTAGMAVLLLTKDPAWKAVLLAFCTLLVMGVTIPRLWMAAFTREDAWLTVLVVCAWTGLLAPQLEALFGRKG